MAEPVDDLVGEHRGKRQLGWPAVNRVARNVNRGGVGYKSRDF